MIILLLVPIQTGVQLK